MGVIAATDVTRRYGEGDAAVDALKGVSLDVPAGQFAAVMGPSGSGKSTLMHILAGLDRPTSGTVSIDGTDISELNDKKLTLLRRHNIGFIFQFFNLLPTLTAEENILLPLQIAGTKPDSDWVESVIDRVGLGDRRRHRPAELSGGQQQRVAIARALVSRPTVMPSIVNPVCRRLRPSAFMATSTIGWRSSFERARLMSAHPERAVRAQCGRIARRRARWAYPQRSIRLGSRPSLSHTRRYHVRA